MRTVRLTDEELRITRGALRSYLSDFGHDEVEVLRLIKEVITKLDNAESSGDLPDPGPRPA